MTSRRFIAEVQVTEVDDKGRPLPAAVAPETEAQRFKAAQDRSAGSKPTYPRRLLPYAGLATYLRVSTRQAQELARAGEVPKVQIGMRVIFDIEDIDRYIERLKRLS